MDVKKTDKTLQYIATGIVVVAALGIGFGGGVVFEKGKSPKTAVANNGGTTNSRFGASDGLGTRRGGFGNFGTVTAVTGTSITVTGRRSSTPTTYTITSSTKVLNGTATASTSDIKAGDTVMIQVSTTNSQEATQITLNPQFPGGGQQGGAQSGADDQMPTTQLN